MANDLAPTTPQRNFFEAYGDAASGSSIIGDLLKFTKFGEWKAGIEETDIEMGTELLMYMPGLQIGWRKWLDNKIVENRMGLVLDGFSPATRDQLGDDDESEWDAFDDGRPKDPWVFVNVVVMLDPNTGQLFTYPTQSKGGISAIGEVSKVYGARLHAHPNEIPVVELGGRSYDHKNKSYGEIRAPVLKVIGWCEPPDELKNASSQRIEVEASDQQYKLPAPKKKNGMKTIEGKATPIKQVPAKPAAKPVPGSNIKNAQRKGVRF